MEAFQVLYREDNIYLDLMEVYPEEGCGLLLNKKGKIEWMPCKNTSDTPEESFHIDASDYIKASLKGDIYAIVHSHPDFSSLVAIRQASQLRPILSMGSRLTTQSRLTITIESLVLVY